LGEMQMIEDKFIEKVVEINLEEIIDGGSNNG
jgi:hypothetical protein